MTILFFATILTLVSMITAQDPPCAANIKLVGSISDQQALDSASTVTNVPSDVAPGGIACNILHTSPHAPLDPVCSDYWIVLSGGVNEPYLRQCKSKTYSGTDISICSLDYQTVCDPATTPADPVACSSTTTAVDLVPAQEYVDEFYVVSTDAIEVKSNYPQFACNVPTDVTFTEIGVPCNKYKALDNRADGGYSQCVYYSFTNTRKVITPRGHYWINRTHGYCVPGPTKCSATTTCPGSVNTDYVGLVSAQSYINAHNLNDPEVPAELPQLACNVPLTSNCGNYRTYSYGPDGSVYNGGPSICAPVTYTYQVGIYTYEAMYCAPAATCSNKQITFPCASTTTVPLRSAQSYVNQYDNLGVGDSITITPGMPPACGVPFDATYPEYSQMCEKYKVVANTTNGWFGQCSLYSFMNSNDFCIGTPPICTWINRTRSYCAPTNGECNTATTCPGGTSTSFRTGRNAQSYINSLTNYQATVPPRYPVLACDVPVGTGTGIGTNQTCPYYWFFAYDSASGQIQNKESSICGPVSFDYVVGGVTKTATYCTPTNTCNNKQIACNTGSLKTGGEGGKFCSTFSSQYQTKAYCASHYAYQSGADRWCEWTNPNVTTGNFCVAGMACWS